MIRIKNIGAALFITTSNRQPTKDCGYLFNEENEKYHMNHDCLHHRCNNGMKI